MATPHTTSILAKRHIRKIGEDLRVARLRRRLPMEVVANRALVTRNTLARVEKGDPAVSFGIYASVMQALNLIERLPDLAGFLKLASIPDWLRVTLTHVSYPTVDRSGRCASDQPGVRADGGADAQKRRGSAGGGE